MKERETEEGERIRGGGKGENGMERGMKGEKEKEGESIRERERRVSV